MPEPLAFDKELILSLITMPGAVPLARMMLALSFYVSGGVGKEVAEAALTGRMPQ